MKAFAFASIILPASAFVGPNNLRTQYRPAVELASCSRPPSDNDYDTSFENLRREFTSSEPSTEKAKEIVDRTFRIFQELNVEASASERKKQRNQEVLAKLQKWIDRSIDLSDEFSRDFPEPQRQNRPTPSGFDREASTMEDVESSPPTTRSTLNEFEVQLDIPGVEFKDLDLRLDESLKIITIVGQRGGKSFSRGIALDSDIDAAQLSASLKNGVLTIRAPKTKSPENKEKRIPVIVEE